VGTVRAILLLKREGSAEGACRGTWNGTAEGWIDALATSTDVLRQDDPEREAYPIVTDLAAFAELVPLDHGLCVINTVRGDGSVQSSVVNAGVLEHPLRGGQVVGLVATGGSRKLRNLRAEPRATIVARAGWQWATVEGAAEIIGPDDPHPDVHGEALRLLLRDIFRAAGGAHDDWDTYDRVMAQERRAAVLIAPRRVYTNPQTS
jgi:PPOX class probable F420-dependent enzyme